MPDLETSLTYCTYCPKLCRHTCPVALVEARETVIPQQMMSVMRLLRHRELDDLPRDDARASAASLYGCTGCLACTTACHHGVTPGVHLFTGRADAERRGIGHPALASLPERVRATAERAAVESRAAVAAAGGTGDGATSRAEVAFFAGCEDPSAAATALALLERAGERDVAVADVSLGCGGYPLLAGGFPEAFRLHAERLAGELAGYRRVVVHCPACAWAMRTQYAAHGVPLAPEVVHTVEHLDGLGDRLPPTTDGAKRPAAFYHDPCYLGRHRGLYDEPRRLAARAVETLREFSRAREEAECSGGGGVLPLTMPAAASAIASTRLAEVHEAGATEVVTACPTCRRQLGREGVTAHDLLALLEAATRPPTG